MNIVLQPAANAAAQKNMEKTVFRSISINSASKHLSEHELDNVKSIFDHDEIKAWGVTSGGANETKWKRLERGDLVLFCAGRKIIAYGEVAMTLHNPGLAAALWGADSKGQVWENIYLIHTIHESNISVIELNRALGYAANNNVQGFDVIRDQSKINSFFSSFEYSDGKLLLKTSIA